jgi:predicted N-acetyltransferase YhbS
VNVIRTISTSIDLGDGLTLRQARVSDAKAVADLAVAACAAKGDYDEATGVWVRDLMERPHPTMTAEDVFVVENAAGEIVSTLNLIPQIWTYDGIPFGVGRVELVATSPDYEGRGLVRRQLDALHRASAGRGHLLQAISGIPSFYRQFGYEYALQFGRGRVAHRASLKSLPTGPDEQYIFRLATPADLPALALLDAQAQTRSLVSCTRDEAAWRYEIKGRSDDSSLHSDVIVLETARDAEASPETVAGFAVVGSGGYPGTPRGPLARVHRFEVGAAASPYAATDGLLRQLTGAGPTASSLPASLTGYEEVAFLLGDSHPAYRAASAVLLRQMRGSAWYIRVPDVAGFLRQITPVLEQRLTASPMANHYGSVSISFYRSGVRLQVGRGRLSWSDWPKAEFRQAAAAFPGLTFLKLLLGYRGLDELNHMYPDCWTTADEARLLLEALFPKQDSAVWPIG